MGGDSHEPSFRDAAIEFRSLHYFVSVAEELHFGRAAERLFISQPALSQAVARLEAALEVELLARTRHHVELTPAGDELLRRGRRLLADRTETVERIRGVGNGTAGIFRAGVALLTEHEVGPVLASLAKTQPEFLLDSSSAISERLVANLRDGRLDAAFVHQVPVLVSAAGVAWEPVRRGPLAAVLPSSHTLAGRDSIRLEQLRDETFIAYPRELAPSAYEGLTLVCQQFGGFEPHLFESPTAATLPLGDDAGLIRGGTAIALLTERAARACTPERTTVVAIEPPPAFVVALAWRRDDPSPRLPRFLDFVRSFRDQHGWLAEPS